MFFPHYQDLDHEDQEWLLSKLPIFYAIFEQCGYVPEEKFDEILSEKPNIDNSPDRNGKPLNDMATNRQRCLIINDNKLEEHKRAREEQRRAVDSSTKNKKKNKKCPLCQKTKSLSLNWGNCKNNGCNFKCCPDCTQVLLVHEDVCDHGKEIQPKRKKQKKT